MKTRKKFLILGITKYQPFGANLETVFLLNFALNLLLFCIFLQFNTKNAENDFFDHWGVQNPIAGRNIQQVNLIHLGHKVGSKGVCNWLLHVMHSEDNEQSSF